MSQTNGLQPSLSVRAEGLEVGPRSPGLRSSYNRNDLPEALDPCLQATNHVLSGAHTACTAPPHSWWQKRVRAWLIVVIAFGWFATIIAAATGSYFAAKILHGIDQGYISSWLDREDR
ncbi:hypothetical protein N7G274_004968 [Stereocaulon virgatum]|uniref:Uncharacterized protein n=1 Tax=Stereocaulon virgatum TaxID=373712 RepID=A0ABR4AAH9_9LECA